MAGLVLGYLCSRPRLTMANVTAPDAQCARRALVFSGDRHQRRHRAVHLIAEITLVLILFHDASTVKLAALRQDPGIAVRLLPSVSRWR
jgi:hypothetical protein